MNNNQIIIKRIVKNAFVLALYVALTFASLPLSFGMIQFRLSELLVLLCFFNPTYAIPLFIGCMLTNIVSPIPFDYLIGSAATLASCLLISIMPRLGIASLLPIVFNGLIVGAELTWLLSENTAAYWVNAGWVALGETVMMNVSYIIIFFTMKNKRILDIIGATRHIDWKW